MASQERQVSLINLPKQVSREQTPAGNPTLSIQHDAFSAILLFDHQTQLLLKSSQLDWQQDETSSKLLLLNAACQLP